MTLPNSQPAAVTSPALAALKVLLVDDDSFQLEMIANILEGLGVTHITMADSGEQALQQLAAPAHFDLMLLDLRMPGMDGFKFMDALTSAGYRGALIIVSGQSDEVMHAATLVATLRRFTVLGTVSKPVGREPLARLLAKLA